MAVCLKGHVFAIIDFLFDARVDMSGFTVPQPYVLFKIAGWPTLDHIQHEALLKRM